MRTTQLAKAKSYRSLGGPAPLMPCEMQRSKSRARCSPVIAREAAHHAGIAAQAQTKAQSLVEDAPCCDAARAGARAAATEAARAAA